MRGHKFIPTYDWSALNHSLAEISAAVDTPTLLDRVVTKVGDDFPAVGAVLHLGRVGSA